MTKILTVWPDGTSFEIYVATTGQIREIFTWNVYDPVKKIAPGDVVVDVGACVGTFTFKAMMEGASKVIAFEPAPDNFEILRKNIGRNKGNFHINQLALSSEQGWAWLYGGITPGGQSFISSDVRYGKNIQDLGRKRVNVNTLDNALKKIDVKKIDFLKIDVEGAAALVLAGARETLERNKVKIGVAVYHHHREKTDVIRVLEVENYVWKGFNQHGHSVEELDDVCFIQAWKD